jgi:thiamine monophosphate kinase
VGIAIDAGALPLSDAVRAWHAAHETDAVTGALEGGDDYELLFTARGAHQGRLRSVQHDLGDPPITRIGVVTRGERLVVRTAAGERELTGGYEHFRA